MATRCAAFAIQLSTSKTANGYHAATRRDVVSYERENAWSIGLYCSRIRVAPRYIGGDGIHESVRDCAGVIMVDRAATSEERDNSPIDCCFVSLWSAAWSSVSGGVATRGIRRARQLVDKRWRWPLGGFRSVLNLLSANVIGGLLRGKHKLHKSEAPCYELAVPAEGRVHGAPLDGTNVAVPFRAIVPRRSGGSCDANSAEYGCRLCRQVGPIVEVLSTGVFADKHGAELRLLAMGVLGRHDVDSGHLVLQGSVRVPV